jgi:hypothetical protein
VTNRSTLGVILMVALVVMVVSCTRGTGSIEGIIVDGSGLPVPGVIVQAAGNSVVTGDDGSFSITDVPVGDYTISASKDGVGSITSEVTVRPDTTTRFDLAFSGAP